MKERSLVDDTLVLLRDASDLPTLLDEISRFERLSNHKMQLSKSTLFLMGRYSKLDPVDGDTEDEQLLRDCMDACGVPSSRVYSFAGDTAVEIPNWHGVRAASEKGIQAQWDKHVANAKASASAIRATQRVTPNGARGRENQARWGVAGKLLYAMKYQTPHSEARVRRDLKAVQTAVDKVAAGGYYWLRGKAATQPKKEGGLGRMDVERHLARPRRRDDHRS